MKISLRNRCYTRQPSNNSSPVSTSRTETRALIGGGGVNIHIFSYQTIDFKRNSSGKTRRYSLTPTPINALVSALSTSSTFTNQTRLFYPINQLEVGNMLEFEGKFVNGYWQSYIHGQKCASCIKSTAIYLLP